MGTTAQGLPYPEVSDRVADGWDAIRDLAVAMDALLAARETALDARLDALEGGAADTAWTALTLATGWTNYAGYGTAGYRRLRGITWLRGLVTRTAGGSANIATLPATFRPAQTGLFVGAANLMFQGHVTGANVADNTHYTHVTNVGARVDINSAGVITPTGSVASNPTTVAFVSLFGIGFPAEI